MNWQEVCDDASLQNLPYKIELDQWGRIIMSPANNRHGQRQARIVGLLQKSIIGGETLVECSIDTSMGTKVADVAWASDAFIRQHGFDTPYTAAPEICVEIRSLSNTAAEMAEKISLYLAGGAREVWICDGNGNMTFHDHSGQMAASLLAPGFPLAL
jgi:Uma2 family endonuclease